MILECSPFGCVAALIGDFFFTMNKLQIFNYNGSKITFSTKNGIMVNATEMAKPFGKTTKDWLRLQSTQDFINALESVRQISLSQLIIIQKGNSKNFKQGTWMHEDVAIEFARWLSPMFAIWCNDRVKELITGGHSIQELYEIIKKQQAQIKQLERKIKLLTSPRAKKERKRRVEVENADEWLASGRIAAIKTNADGWIPFDKIMEDYLEFCKDANVKRVGKNLLGKKLQRKFEHKKRRDTTWYCIIIGNK